MAMSGMFAAEVSPAGRRLGIAALVIAGKVCPTGFDVVSNAPESLEALNARIRETGRLAVWDGASSFTIFGDAEQNYAFRAWHDWTHWALQAPFDADGERAVAHTQVRDLVRVYGPSRDVVLEAAVLLCEVIGQTQFKSTTGAFPSNQYAFDVDLAPSFYPEALRLVREFAPLYGRNP